MLIAMGVFLDAAGVAQSAPPLSIDAHETASGVSRNYDWATSWGSYDRTVQGRKLIEITVRNLGRSAAVAEVTLYVMDANRIPIGTAKREFDMRGKLEERAVVEAPITSLHETRLRALGRYSAQGEGPATIWCAVGRTDGNVFDVAASTAGLREETLRNIRAGRFH